MPERRGRTEAEAQRSWAIAVADINWFTTESLFRQPFR
jgi:hypothetical protein